MIPANFASVLSHFKSYQHTYTVKETPLACEHSSSQVIGIVA